MGNAIVSIGKVVSRRKTVVSPGDGGQPVQRFLTVVDITCLGLATILGTGIYVLLAKAAKDYAGPSVVLSVLIASVASCLGGLCYSEVATRFPRGGSAYAYTYATTGELFGFLIGWSMMLEYTLGAALAAKSLGQYLDVATNGTLEKVFREPLGELDVPGLERHPDMPAVMVILLVGSVAASTIQLSCSLNNGLVVINLLVIIGIVLVGVFNMDAENWTAGPGFFPHGVAEIFSASSVCFFSFIGYDVIATATGEVDRRSKSFPITVTLMFLVGLVATFTAAAAITLLVPFSLLGDKGPLIEAFRIRGVQEMTYFVIIGSTAGLLSAVGTSLFALSRLIQCLSNDGLLFRLLGMFSPDTGIRCKTTIVASLLSSVVALLADSWTLTNTIGMGTIISFASVAVAVLRLRYGISERLPLELGELSRESTAPVPRSSSGISDYYSTQVDAETQTAASVDSKTTSYHTGITDNPIACTSHNELSSVMADTHRNYGTTIPRTVSVEFINESFVSSIWDLSTNFTKRSPNNRSTATTAILIFIMIVIMAAMAMITLRIPPMAINKRMWTDVIFCTLFVALILCVIFLLRQPRHRPRSRNSVPCIPLLPVFAIWIDIQLLLGLPHTAWRVFCFWELTGVAVYLCYGVWHSTERRIGISRDVSLLGEVDDISDQEQSNNQNSIEAC